MRSTETVKTLLTELIDMIDNGSQRDLDRADEIGAAIIKLFEENSVIDKVRADITELDTKLCQQFLIEDADKEVHHAYQECLEIIDKYSKEEGKE